MTKLIGYARVSLKQQSTDRQESDLLAARTRRDDSYVGHVVSGARASRPQVDRALDALTAGDTLVITTRDRLGRSTQKVLALAEELRGRGAGLRVALPTVRSEAPSASSKRIPRPPRALATSERPARPSAEGHEPSPTSRWNPLDSSTEATNQ